jgi:hypothetical protein
MKYDDDAFEQLQARLVIDKNQLDDELVWHSQNFFHVTEGCAYHNAVRDKRHLDMDVAYAELDGDIRDTAEVEDLRLSEAQIRSLIHRDPRYRTARLDFIEARHDAAKWDGLKNSYRKRAEQLRDLVDLARMNYYGEISTYERPNYYRHHRRN